MSTLYLDRRDLELRTDGGALAFYEAGVRRGTVPLASLERVVIRATVALDTRVLGALAERGVGLVTLAPRRGRRTAILLGPPHNDVTRRLGQYRGYLDVATRCRWSRELVYAKVRAQRRLLTRGLARRPDRRKRLSDGIERLDAAMARLGPGCSAKIAVLRGIEGAAAAAYFKALTGLFPRSLRFTGRNRRPPRDPVNACLSLGYTLLHFDAVQAAHGAGLDPLLGLYHEPEFGRESLATDLIEPLRPHVDAWVWELFRTRVLTREHFRDDKGACLLGKAGRRQYYERYEDLARATRRLLRREAGRLARRFTEEGADLLSGREGVE